MPTHSTLLGYGEALGVGSHTIYTVPAGKRTIVKGLLIQNLGTAAQRIAVSAFNGSEVAWNVAVDLAAHNAVGDSGNISLWAVMNAGYTLSFHVQSGTARCAASGAELSVT